MKTLAVTLLLITTLLFTPVLAAELRIGVVDVDDIINKSPDYKRIESALKQKSEELQRPLQQREQDIGRQVAEYQKQAESGIIKDEAKKRKEAELQKKIEEIQKSKGDAARTFQSHYEREMKPLMDKFNKAMEQVANDEKLDLIIPKAGIYLRNKSLDVTEKVRSQLK